MSIEVKNKKFLKLLQEQNHPDTKYYLVDSNRAISFINGLNRMEAFDLLVDSGVIKITTKSLIEIGVVNIINSINAILNGEVELGRFRFFRVTPESMTLEEQIEFNNRLLLDEIKKVD